MGTTDCEFIPPPEAPIFRPTPEEFKDPLGYISKIRPIAEQTGICKIKPPPDWQPPFVVDVDNFRFTPRVQRLNELEATTRIKLNFLDKIAKFWELQGSSLKIPNVERKALDLYTLHKIVKEEGGMEVVTKERRWAKIASRMGYPHGRSIGSLLRQHYERILYPYDIFKSGASIREINISEETEDSDKKDKDYIPHGIPSRQAIKPPPEQYSRRSKRHAKESDIDDIDYSTNNELKKLQFYGAGPKMPGFCAQTKQEVEECTKSQMLIKRKEKGKCKSTPIYRTNQHAGEFVITFPRSYHAGFNQGYNFAEAVNFAPADWLPIGRVCISHYSMLHRFCVFSHDELVCKMAADPERLDISLAAATYQDMLKMVETDNEVRKPQEAFGFEQAQREYTLQEFGEMADKFKSNYFNMAVHELIQEAEEKKFPKSDLLVALETAIQDAEKCASVAQQLLSRKVRTRNRQSTENKCSSQLTLEDLQLFYEKICNLACEIKETVLIKKNKLSYFQIPWTYVGMCFATFCWHNEDHWSYSINYLHWGEPKTWYGVPGDKAEAFEDSMRSAAPELFRSQPDLLHQLVTIMNPNILMSAGVPIYRTNQHAGEFVITFPRSYHAGFNQGYNFAEAVNFAPADWLPIGRVCISHYSMLHRFCVFSHDELVCKMAADPERLDISLAAATYQDMLKMVETEREYRKSLLEWGVTEAEREAFELLPDDERQCDYCKTTCFLSAVTCNCNSSKLVCITHKDRLCHCSPEEHCLRYRYTLDELPVMLHRLKVRAESFDNWAIKVKNALEATEGNKLEILELKELIQEAEEKKFPKSDLLVALETAIQDAEKCASVAQQLLSRKVRTSSENIMAQHTINIEIVISIDQIVCHTCGRGDAEESMLLCDGCDDSYHTFCLVPPLNEIPKGDWRCPKCVAEIDQIVCHTCGRGDAEESMLLCDGCDDSYHTFCLVPPLNEIPKGDWRCPKCVAEYVILIKDLLDRVLGFERDAKVLLSEDMTDLKKLEKQLDIGLSLDVDLSEIPKLKQKLQQTQWLEEVRISLSNPQQVTLDTLRKLLDMGVNIPPHQLVEKTMGDLQEMLTTGEKWEEKAKTCLQAKPYNNLSVLETIVNETSLLPVHLPNTLNVKDAVKKAKEWIAKVEQVMNGDHYTYLEIVEYLVQKGRPIPVHLEQLQHLEVQVEVATAWKERTSRTFLKKNSYYTLMEVNNIYLESYLANCVPLPKSASSKKQSATNTVSHLVHEVKFLCPMCMRSRRPRLETILALLVSLQKLPVRLPEGEALQNLTERAMTWQDNARQALATEELAAALAKLSVISQRKVEQAAREKTEKIISKELMKAASNPELKPHLQNVAQTAFSGLQQTNKEIDEKDIGNSLGNIPESEVPPVATEQEVPSSEPALIMDVETTVENGNDITNIANGHDDSEIPLNYNLEHAYSSASKSTTGVTPRKHARKSPLIPRQLESPVLQLSDVAKAQLEELMMEGDLLEVSLDETQHIWRILQATRLNRDPLTSLDPFSEPEETDSSNQTHKKKFKKRKLEDCKGIEKMKFQTKSKLSSIKENGKPRKKRMKINKFNDEKTGNCTAHTNNTRSNNSVNMGNNNAEHEIKNSVKKQLKIKNEPNDLKEKKENGVTIKKDGPKINRTKQKLLEKPKIKKSSLTSRAKITSSKKGRRENNGDDAGDDFCSATRCLRPTGEAVNWVQCDGGCEEWFHLLCVGLNVTDISESEDYICPHCTHRQNGVKLESEDENSNAEKESQQFNTSLSTEEMCESQKSNGVFEECEFIQQEQLIKQESCHLDSCLSRSSVHDCINVDVNCDNFTSCESVLMKVEPTSEINIS
ncbi:lysine-specific demethylase 5A-like [Centruroides sculpturatus]|uniref:lysine-specific demethylase 5A-like n=1 Tax=Centruroides sculpturatus TaxID=218467 RepID=UPI000C6DAC1A|nr:lysine-specific demethylase 5A-like [Centruroides sculpturatus]